MGNALNGVPEESEGPINDSRYGNPDDVAAEEKEEIAEKVIAANTDRLNLLSVAFCIPLKTGKKL